MTIKLSIVSACAISVTSQTESALVTLDGLLLVGPFVLAAQRWGDALRVGHFDNMLSTSAQCL